MQNTAGLAIYASCLIMTAVILTIAIWESRGKRLNNMFIILCLCFICWLLSDSLTLIVANEAANLYIWSLKLIFVGFVPPAQLLTIYPLYHPEYRLSARALAALLAIPSINAVMAITSPHHSLLRIVESITIFPARAVVSSFGPWFWVHSAYCYTVTLITIWVIISGHIRKPKIYRLSSTFLITAISIVIAGNFTILLGHPLTNIDLTIIASSVALIFIRLAINTENNNIFYRYARGQVFNHLEDFVIITGKNGDISDFNPSAEHWFSSVGIKLRGHTVQDILDAFTQKGALINEEAESYKNHKNIDITFTYAGVRKVLNMRDYDMTDERGKKQGAIAIFTDVTQNRTMLERLEKKAGIDGLTGLANRTAYEGAKTRLDAEEYFPLSVIGCDVNGLKEVNDNLGHKYGDILLHTVAEIFESAAPKTAFIARIGGDEFIFLLPHTDADSAREFMDTIKEALKERDNLPFILSVAMGKATKYKPEESLDDLISLADQQMYEDKKQIKSQNTRFIK